MPLLLALVSTHSAAVRRPPTLDYHQQNVVATWNVFLIMQSAAQTFHHCLPPIFTAGEDGGRTNQKEIWKETQDPSSFNAATFRALCVQSQGPQSVRFPQLRRRTILTGNRILFQTYVNDSSMLVMWFHYNIYIDSRQKERSCLSPRQYWLFWSYLVFQRTLCFWFTEVVFIVQIHSGSSEAEEENDPDGCYAFRRKAGCQYYAVSALLWLPCFYL